MPWQFTDKLLVTTAAILLLAVVAVAINRHRHRNAREHFVADLLASKAAFQSFLRLQTGAPPDTAPGLVPVGMEPYLEKIAWSKPTPVGGVYRWVAREGPAKATFGVIALTAFPPAPEIRLSVDDLLEIDRRIDDGNLATGDFRTGFNGWPTLIVRSRF